MSLPSSAYVHQLRQGNFDLTILGVEHHPFMRYDQVLPKYLHHILPNFFNHASEEYLDTLIKTNYLRPLWQSQQFKIHHQPEIMLQHLQGLDQLDLLATWKIK